MTLKEFLKTKTFRINALAAVGITIFLILLNMLALRIYTSHGDSIGIPDLRGKTTAQVNALVNKLSLRYQIRDSVYSRETAPGTVLDQFPKPGSKVKGNRIILVTLCAVSQEKIPMPQLTDISYRQAVNIIESAGLIAGNISYKPSEFPNLVLEQKVSGKPIRIGQMIPKGTVIDLVLGGNSSGEFSQVPTLLGRSLTEARMMIGEALLNVGTINYDSTIVTDDQKVKALIWKQSPDPAEIFEVAPGTSVELWLSADSLKLEPKPKTEEPENSFF